jgi:hypothetical protein
MLKNGFVSFSFQNYLNFFAIKKLASKQTKAAIITAEYFSQSDVSSKTRQDTLRKYRLASLLLTQQIKFILSCKISHKILFSRQLVKLLSSALKLDFSLELSRGVLQSGKPLTKYRFVRGDFDSKIAF